MFHTRLTLMMYALAFALVQAREGQAQSVCRTADANTALLISFLGRYSSATAGDDPASRDLLKLPSAPVSQLSVVTQDATCRKAKATYEAVATAEGGTGLSGRVYVIKIGTVFAVVDPSYHWGPDPGWWKVVTMDSKFKKLSGSTVKGV
jgi:hypothetical protein